MALLIVVRKMANPKKKAAQEKPKLSKVIDALYSGDKNVAQGIPGYAEEIRAGIKKAKKVVYMGEVADAASNELLTKAVTEIMSTNPYSETVKDMFGVLAIGENFGYDKMTFGDSYENGVKLNKETLMKKIADEANGTIEEFEAGLQLPKDITPEEREALKAAKRFGVAAAYADVIKHIPSKTSYANLTEAYVNLRNAPVRIASSGAGIMDNYLKSLREGRDIAAKKKAGIPVGEK